MLLLMSIFALMSAGMYYASRVGAVQDEIALLTGAESASSTTPNRIAHLTFLMFTYTSPLLLAMLLGVIHSWMRMRDRTFAPLRRTEK